MDRRAFLTMSALGLAGAFFPLPAFCAPPVVTLVPLLVTSKGRHWAPPALAGFPHEISAVYRVDVRIATQVRLDIDERCRAGDVLDDVRRVHGHALGLTSAPLVLERLGVSGYADAPGDAAVVTTHWRTNGVTPAVAHRRTLGVIVHELGHNFGASDCDDEACTMYNDPTGRRRRLDAPIGVYCDAHYAVLQDWLRAGSRNA